MKIVMLAEKNLSWSSTTQWSNLSYQYAATLAVAQRPWHVAEQIYLRDFCCRQVWTQSGLSCIVFTWSREKLADGGRYASAMKQNLCRVLCSVSLHHNCYTSVSACIYRHMVGTHVPAAYSDVAAHTTAVHCTVDAHILTILHGCLQYASYFKLTLKLDA